MRPSSSNQTRRGFTLLELLVVVSIMVLALLVFSTVLGSRATGPALDRTAAAVTSMVANVRQNAAVRKVHGEIVLDYKRDRVVALARRRLVSFAMESEEGSGGVLGKLTGGATFQASRSMQLRDGKCLELPGKAARFIVPWAPEFNVSGDYEGLAFAFDFYPMDQMRADGSSEPVPGDVALMASVLQLAVPSVRHDSVRLALSCSGATVTTGTWLATWRWHRIEVAVSRYSVSLWVDGRLDEAVLPDGFEVPSASGLDLRLGGTPCRMDNLEVFSLISSQTLQLDGCQFIAPDVDPMKEAQGEAENIHRDRTQPEERGPVTGPDAEPAPMTGPGTGLPADPVPAIRHIHYDAAGKLDASRHGGAENVYLISWDGDDLRRMVLTFHRLGTVTSEYLELFPWEQAPDPQQAGATGSAK